jgi:LPS export ABC transporter protein LptC
MTFLLFLSFALISGLKKRNLLVFFNDVGGKADIKIGQFSVVQSYEGVKRWELKADRAEVFEKDQKALLEKVAVTIQTSQGIGLSLEGDAGSINTRTKDFYLEKKEGPMVIQLSNGYTIETPALSWLNEQKMIVAEGPAHITGPQVEISGSELRVAPENQEVTISGHVQALVY